MTQENSLQSHKPGLYSGSNKHYVHSTVFYVGTSTSIRYQTENLVRYICVHLEYLPAKNITEFQNDIINDVGDYDTWK